MQSKVRGKTCIVIAVALDATRDIFKTHIELKNPDFNLYASNFEITQLIKSKSISFTEIKSATGERYEQSLKYLVEFEEQKNYFEKNDSFKEVVKKGQSSAPNTIYRTDFYKNVAKTILDNSEI